MKRLRLTASFALVSLVAIAAAAFVVSRVSERAATNQMVRAIEHAAAGEAFMIIDEVLLRGRPEDDAGHHAAGPDEAALLETLIANDGLGEEFAAHTKPLNLMGALLFGSDGRLVWSTEPGHETGDGGTEMFEKALGGEVASRLTRDYATTGPDGEAVRIDVVETYVPVRAMPGGPVIGVFEIYKDATEDQHALVAGAGSSAARRTVYTMGGLFLVLLGFVVAADLTMHRARGREREAREQLKERNRRLRETEAQLQREARESAALAEIGRIVSSSLDIGEVYERLASAVRLILPLDWIEIVRIDRGRGTATRVSVSGDVWPLDRKIVLAGTIAGGAADAAETLLVLTDTPEALLERFPGADPDVVASCRSIIAMPLAYEGSVVGALLLLSREQQAYSRQDLVPAERVAAQISGAIANAELHAATVRAEQALRIRGAAVDSALDAMIVANRDGVITLANPAAQRMFAKPGVDLAGQPLEGIIPEEYREAHRAGFKRVAEDGTPRVLGTPVTLEALAADGSRLPIELSLGRVEGAEDGAFVATIRDITERRRQEAEHREREELAAELRELQRLSEAHSEFLSTVSHELKTPLTSVLAFADILARNRGQNFTERQQQHLGMIQRNGRRLGALIDDLLDVSRVDTGRLKLVPIEFDVRVLLDEIAEGFKPMLADKGQTLQTDFPPGGTGLRADRNRLAQVVLNLLNNASKYSPEASRIEARAWVEEERLYIQVRDHGIGISRRDQGKLFTAFFRADNTETRSESGTGLGLLIVKSIVELHGGEVSLESERGKGTAVRLWVPGLLADALEASEEKAPQQPTSRLAA